MNHLCGECDCLMLHRGSGPLGLCAYCQIREDLASLERPGFCTTIQFVFPWSCPPPRLLGTLEWCAPAQHIEAQPLSFMWPPLVVLGPTSALHLGGWCRADS